MSPELAAIVDGLHASGRMAEVDYERLLYEIVRIGWRAAVMAAERRSVDVDTLTAAARTVQTQLRATVVDRDPAALGILLEGLIPLARFVGDDPIRLLVATGLLTDEEIPDRVDQEARRHRWPHLEPSGT